MTYESELEHIIYDIDSTAKRYEASRDHVKRRLDDLSRKMSSKLSKAEYDLISQKISAFTVMTILYDSMVKDLTEISDRGKLLMNENEMYHNVEDN